MDPTLIPFLRILLRAELTPIPLVERISPTPPVHQHCQVAQQEQLKKPLHSPITNQISENKDDSRNKIKMKITRNHKIIQI